MTQPEARHAPTENRLLPQRLEARAQLLYEQVRLFPRCKVPAFLELVVMDELGIRPLCPTAWRCIDLIGENAHGYRDGYVLEVEKWQLVFPIETCRRNPRVRQPEERDVVEHIVSCQVCWMPVKGTCDELQAFRVVVEYPRSEANRRIHNSIECLWAVPHLLRVGDFLRKKRLQLL